MENLSKIIEGILFVAGESVAFVDIADKLEIDIVKVNQAIKELQQAKKDANDGIQVLIFNEKAQLCSNKNYADYIAQVLNPIKEKMLTKVLLEVCGIIAYKQPVTRLEIENVRGGANCDYAISMLLENNLIEVVGRKDAVGKPLLFGTTDAFLKKFNISSLNDLPDYDQLLERIKVLHEETDSSLFNFKNIDPADDLSEEEVQDILKTVRDSRDEINSERNRLDGLLGKFSDELDEIPAYKFDNLE